MTENRLCPFRQIVDTIRREARTTQYADRYQKCLGQSCMAYDAEAKDCMRLSRVNAFHEKLREVAHPWKFRDGKYVCPLCMGRFEKQTNYCPACGQRLEVEVRPLAPGSGGEV